MSEQIIKIANHYRRKVRIDDAEGNDIELELCVRRFSAAQLQTFTEGWKRTTAPRAEWQIARTSPEELETEVQTVGRLTRSVFKVTDAEIRRRRLNEMTPEQLAAFRRTEDEDEAFALKFYTDAIREHLWIPAHVTLRLEGDNGDVRTLRTGQDLVDAFAGNLSTLAMLVLLILQENTWSPDQKQTFHAQQRALRATRTPPAPLAADSDGLTVQ